VFVAGWAVLAASAIGLFRRKQTSMITFRPAGTLVTSGPYTFTRNPMYVAMAFLTIAFALFLNNWWTMLLLVPTLLIVQQFVIVPEERYLQRRFGVEYEAYTRRVRRWL
jgi:protein-S-isoprenylcysteine O-methyltransferase Ste14